jgi:UDP-N-acetylmuramate dehydrogenase
MTLAGRQSHLLLSETQLEHFVQMAAELAPSLEPERLRRNEPMAGHTTFRIGGPADIFVEPASVAELTALIQTARACGLPVTVLGNGSNVLVADRGIRGLVISLGQPMARIRREGLCLVAEAGALLSSVAAMAAREGLGGLAFASGIPGTIGGAIMMNAGAYGHCMAERVESTTCLEKDLSMQVIRGADHAFGYRESCFRGTDRIILETTLTLTPQDPAAIRDEMAQLAARRRNSQPLDLPSAGSAFKRPPGHYAGQLIAECGLKGFRIGDAAVSERHAGFIVNMGQATASDVACVFRHVQATVLARTGVALEQEVLFIGDWD